MNDFFSIFVEITARLTEGFCLYFLFKKFGKQRIKSDVKLCAVTVAVWVILSKMISLAIFPDGTQTLGKEFVSIILRAMLMCVIGIFLYNINKNVLAFIALTFTSFLYISSHISPIVGLLLLNGLDLLAMKTSVMFSMKFLRILTEFTKLTRWFLLIVILIISTRIFIKNCRHDLNNRSTKEIISYMLPVIMGSISAVMLHFIISFINNNGHIEYDNYRDDYYVYFAVAVVFFAIWITILVSFKIQQDIIGLQEEQIQKSIYENQISQMQSSMTEMEVFYDGISSVKHDMKNQMEALKNMMKKQSGADKNINGYFDDMQNTIDKLEQKIHTGNAVSDAVINAKFKLAEKEIPGIKLNADDFILTDSIKIKPYDIGIILNNGLDNAIEACRNVIEARGSEADDFGNGVIASENEGRNSVYITLKSFMKKNMFFIEIENSYSGNIVFDENGLPKTNKPESRLHGIGLKNIRSCALKYMGDIECIAKDGVFVLSVMVKA